MDDVIVLIGNVYVLFTITSSLSPPPREYLLAVLLHLTQVLVKGEPPANRESTLGGSLARDLIKVRGVRTHTLDHDVVCCYGENFCTEFLVLINPPPPQTLTVCYLRASMVIRVSAELWDSLLVVLSALTHWRETIEQWKVSGAASYGGGLLGLPTVGGLLL